MTHALDSNAVSVAFRNGDSGPARGILAHPRGSIAVPDVVRGEILFGALKGGSPRIISEIRAFLDHFPSLPFNDQCVEVYAQARAELERTGQRIGALDLLIAATALANNLILVIHKPESSPASPVCGLRIGSRLSPDSTGPSSFHDRHHLDSAEFHLQRGELTDGRQGKVRLPDIVELWICLPKFYIY